VTTAKDSKTAVGNYFISNYPPYSFWKPEKVAEAMEVLERPPASTETPLGVYLHIPFCRKRCRFCYYRVYTDKNAEEIQRYVQAAVRELAFYAARPLIAGRDPEFVYFGGGTPSYLSVRQLTVLTEEMKRLLVKTKEGGFGGDYPDYCDLIAGTTPGRTRDDQITFYHNMGNQGLQFSSVGGLVYRKAKAAGLGREFPTEWLLQDIRD